MINLFKPEIDSRSLEFLKSAIDIGQINKGENLDGLTKKFQDEIGLFGDILFVNSATAGLHIALEAVDVRGGFVITPSQSFMATGLAVLYAGAKPIFIDIERKTGNIDVNLLEEAVIRFSPKAIIGVHWGGNPCDVEVMNSISTKYSIPLIYDCAHSLSTNYMNESILNHGDFSICSFQAIKEITCGDGGMVVINNKKYKNVRNYAWFGMSRDANRNVTYYNHLGYKYNMNNLSASILSSEINEVKIRAKKRRVIANRYSEIVPEKNRVIYFKDSTPSYWLYSIFVEDIEGAINFFDDKGIEVSGIDKSMVNNPIFGVSIDHYPENKYFEKSHLAIPCRHNLSENEVELIANVLKEYWS